MSDFQSLKEEQAVFVSKFNSDHGVFRIKAFTLDEISCKFMAPSGPIELTGNITENYPLSPPIWFSDCEDSAVNAVLEGLEELNPEHFSVSCQLKLIVFRLCNQFNIPFPSDDFSSVAPELIPSLAIVKENPPTVDCTSGTETEGDEEYEYAEMPGFDALDITSGVDNALEKATIFPYDGIKKEDVQRLKDIREHSTTQGSSPSSERLLKELREIYRSQNYASGVYSVELKDDNIYDWQVNIYKFDEDSGLSNDLVKCPEHNLDSHVALQFIFDKSYPFEPPFVRVIYPVILKGFVYKGGAICMELLTKDGWSSVYDVESLIMQIAATMVKGEARVDFNQTPALSDYNLRHARKYHEALAKLHQEDGWSAHGNG